jgi:hypothetical protein
MDKAHGKFSQYHNRKIPLSTQLQERKSCRVHTAASTLCDQPSQSPGKDKEHWTELFPMPACPFTAAPAFFSYRGAAGPGPAIEFFSLLHAVLQKHWQQRESMRV